VEKEGSYHRPDKGEHTAALKGSADTRVQLKGNVSLGMRVYLCFNADFCLHGGLVHLPYGSLKGTKEPVATWPSQGFEVCVVNLKVMRPYQCFPFVSWHLKILRSKEEKRSLSHKVRFR